MTTRTVAFELEANFRCNNSDLTEQTMPVEIALRQSTLAESSRSLVLIPGFAQDGSRPRMCENS